MAWLHFWRKEDDGMGSESGLNSLNEGAKEKKQKEAFTQTTVREIQEKLQWENHGREGMEYGARENHLSQEPKVTLYQKVVWLNDQE